MYKIVQFHGLLRQTKESFIDNFEWLWTNQPVVYAWSAVA